MQSTEKQSQIEPKNASNLQILAIDTSAKWVSVAILQGDKVLAQLDSREMEAEGIKSDGAAGTHEKVEIPAGFSRKRSKGKTKSKRIFPPGASTLLPPMIKMMLVKTDSAIQDFDLIAVTVGPGLFTGLRVGVVIAKAFAYSSGAALVGINTLELLAVQAANKLTPGVDSQLYPVINAQRRQLFTGCFRAIDNWQVEQKGMIEIMEQDAWANSIEANGLVTGSALQPLLASNPHLNFAPESCWETTAVSTGILAWHKFQAGIQDDFWKLQPSYFRPSAAEEVRNQKLKNEQTARD